MEKIVQNEASLQVTSNDSMTQDPYLAVTPPMTGISFVASTPPPRFSQSPIMVPITPPLMGHSGGTLPSMPLTHSPMNVPVTTSSPLPITSHSYPVNTNDQFTAYSPNQMSAPEAGLPSQHKPN